MHTKDKGAIAEACVIADYFAIYCPELDRVAYVPVSDLAANKNFSLRVKPAKNSQLKHVRLFDEYSALE